MKSRRIWQSGAIVAAMLIAIVAGTANRAHGDAETGSGIAAPAGVVTAGQSNVSAYPVLQRLGRWNGSTFVPVTAGSIQPGHAIFMSHGWSPGFQSSYQQLQATSTELVTAWNPGLVNAKGASFMGDFNALAAALSAADPTATIVMFSWVDQSATPVNPLDARIPEQATEVNGHRFATAIDEALAPGFVAAGGQVHLLGHSFGANVATTAALALASPPRQLTLFDSPEVELAEVGGAANVLRYKLPRLTIGRGVGQTFVDNYISLVGEPYAGFPGLSQVVDVRTAPPALSAAEKHEFAIVWYTDSVNAPQPQVGYGWSPLTGANDSNVGSYYQQPSPSEPLALTMVNGPPPTNVTDSFGVGETALVLAHPADAALSVSGTEVANIDFTTTTESLWLTFDAAMQGRPGDLLTLFIDGRERYQASVTAGTGKPGSFITLNDLGGGSHSLAVTISGSTPSAPAAPASQAQLSHLAITSTAGIERNFSAVQTKAVVGAVTVSAITVVRAFIGLVVLGLVFLAARLFRRRRRRPIPDQ
ncbi:MAG: hypothetical protein WCK41_07465 [Actinomycetes bacterium]